MMETNRFAFGEVVKIIHTNQKNSHLYGALATVNGMVKNDDDKWYYSIFISSENCTWCFYEEELSKSQGEVPIQQ